VISIRPHDLHDAGLDGPGHLPAVMKKPPGRGRTRRERRYYLAALLLASLLIGGCTVSYVGLMILAGGAMAEGWISVNGRVYDEWGWPVQGASVTLSSGPRFRLFSGEVSSLDGAFSVEISFGGWGAPVVKDNPFTLRVEKEGFIPVERQIVEDTELRIVLLRKTELPWFIPQTRESAPRERIR
jgi:hypothetical protein